MIILAAIKIQTQKSYIPIQLGDLELRFDISDESIKHLRKKLIEVKDRIEKTQINEGGGEAIKQLKDALKEGFDTIFGNGTFDNVYEISPSVMIVTEYFKQIFDAIFKELEERGLTSSAQEKAQKYLANKNKKK